MPPSRTKMPPDEKRWVTNVHIAVTLSCWNVAVILILEKILYAVLPLDSDYKTISTLVGKLRTPAINSCQSPYCPLFISFCPLR